MRTDGPAKPSPSSRSRRCRGRQAFGRLRDDGRVFIIDGAEDLSLDAANRLLKTLEEPPASVLLVLLAADEHSVLPTVLSRCWVHRLQPVSRRIIEETLTARFEDRGEL